MEVKNKRKKERDWHLETQFSNKHFPSLSFCLFFLDDLSVVQFSAGILLISNRKVPYFEKQNSIVERKRIFRKEDLKENYIFVKIEIKQFFCFFYLWIVERIMFF